MTEELSQSNPNGPPDTTKKELHEREKELNCLYSLSNILKNEDLQPDTVFNQIVNIIPPAWQYPEITCAQIIIKKKEFKTQNFRETPWKLSKPLNYKGKPIGILEIFYLKKRPDEHIGPFLNQEIKLLDVIIERLENYLNQLDLTKELKGKIAVRTQPEWQIIINMLTKTDPQQLFRITRKMLYYISRRQQESLDTLMMGLSCPIGPDAKPSEWCGINMPNPKQDLQDIMRIQKGVFSIAEQILNSDEITNLITLWLRQDRARPLLMAVENSGISLAEVTDVLKKIRDIPQAEIDFSYEDDISIRTNLIRRFFTERLEFINIAKNYIRIDDFIALLEKVTGPSRGSGKLGGKTAGVYLAEKIIQKEIEKEKDPHLEEITFAKSWYLTSDTMWYFIHYNDLDEVVHTKYMDPKDIRQEQPFLEQVFKNAAFPSEIIDELRNILRAIGDKPIIIRSSSLLEDSFGAAFSGKYKSLFIANIGSEDIRLYNLMDAIAEIYASTFNSDPIEYRRERGLLDFTEGMGILIQEVVGKRIGPYYFPSYAGVAFSNNEFRWSPRIQRKDGFIRMVAGLGTRAVDRVADDYPVLISPRRPNIRVNAMVDETIYYSQHYMDVINMETGIIETVQVNDILQKYGDQYPQLNQIVSIHQESHLYTPTSIILDPGKTDMIVTFGGLFEKGKFIKQMKWVLNILTERLNTPVDVEFASDGTHLYILQCRPQSQGVIVENVTIPKQIPKNRILFTADKYITNGRLDNIKYVVYVTPQGYESLEQREDMLNVAKIVSQLNEKLPKRQFILLGPGRWGSRGDIKLGVPVQYRDINNTSLLIEVARMKQGGAPELSFGTHFFQDLVEANIQYLPLYPDEEKNIFNENLLNYAPNRLEKIIPNPNGLESVIKVIEISDIADGGTLSIVMDGETQEAMAYLIPIDHSTWRLKKVKELAEKLNPERYGIISLYLIGSAKEGTAGEKSDIDLLIHVRATKEQQEDLLAWFYEQSIKIDNENELRTGKKTEGILDVHIITDQDIENKTSWAVHINSLDSPAQKIPLKYQPE